MRVKLSISNIVKEHHDDKNWYKVVDKEGKTLYEHPEFWGCTEYVRIQNEKRKTKNG